MRGSNLAGSWSVSSPWSVVSLKALDSKSFLVGGVSVSNSGVRMNLHQGIHVVGPAVRNSWSLSKFLVVATCRGCILLNLLFISCDRAIFLVGEGLVSVRVARGIMVGFGSIVVPGLVRNVMAHAVERVTEMRILVSDELAVQGPGVVVCHLGGLGALDVALGI